MKQCRLLYVVGQLGLGGLERQLYYLLSNLDHSLYKPALVVWNINRHDAYYHKIEALKIPIYGFPAPWSTPSKLRAFRTLTRNLDPEVIHSYGFHTNFAAYYAARRTRAIAIGSLRGDLASERKAAGSLRAALNGRWPDFHIANSLVCAEAARRHSSLFVPKHFSLVRNGLDLDRFGCLGKSSKTSTYIAAAGSLLPVKRWDRLLRAFKEVKFKVGAVSLRIAGDGPLRSSLEDLTKSLDMSRSVTFMGAVDDVASFLRGAKFLVHTSESEGCPNVVMEAMACGVPVVAMEAGDIPYLIEEGRTGFVVPQGDKQALVNRMLQLLGDEQLCISMGIVSRQKAERDFSLQRFVSETLGAYHAAGWIKRNAVHW
jgi:glycosyltransferase involved in cell wall biosynthesis